MGRKLVIFGARSTAVSIAEVAESLGHWKEIIRIQGDSERLDEAGVFDKEYAQALAGMPGGVDYIISMANQKTRAGWLQFATEHKMELANVVSAMAYVAPSAKIGKGVYVAPGAVLSSRCFLNDHVIVNYNATVGHDTVVGSHTSINPGANIGGNVRIGERVLVGANSFIFQGTKIGDDCTIDALTYLNRDMASGMMATSRQLRIIERKKKKKMLSGPG